MDKQHNQPMLIQVTCLHSKGFEFNVTLDHCNSYSEAIDFMASLPSMKGHKILSAQLKGFSYITD